MIVDKLDVMGIVANPAEAQPPLTVELVENEGLMDTPTSVGLSLPPARVQTIVKVVAPPDAAFVLPAPKIVEPTPLVQSRPCTTPARFVPFSTMLVRFSQTDA